MALQIYWSTNFIWSSLNIQIYIERDKKVILKSFFAFKGYTHKEIKAILVIMILTPVVYKTNIKVKNIRNKLELLWACVSQIAQFCNFRE